MPSYARKKTLGRLPGLHHEPESPRLRQFVEERLHAGGRIVADVVDRLESTVFIFFFNDTATTENYTLSLHDALPISSSSARNSRIERRRPHGFSNGWPCSTRCPGSICAGPTERTTPTSGSTTATTIGIAACSTGSRFPTKWTAGGDRSASRYRREIGRAH